MNLKALAKSDTGVTRSSNEDYFGVFASDGLVIVCDGLGGHSAGAKASRLAVKTLREIYTSIDSSIYYKIAKDLVTKNLKCASRLISAIRIIHQKYLELTMTYTELLCVKISSYPLHIIR